MIKTLDKFFLYGACFGLGWVAHDLTKKPIDLDVVKISVLAADLKPVPWNWIVAGKTNITIGLK